MKLIKQTRFSRIISEIIFLTGKKEMYHSKHITFTQKKHAVFNRQFTIRLLIIFILLNLFFLINAFSQLVTNNGAAISISGAVVTVKGDMQENPGATIANNGTIGLHGNWINNGKNDCFGTSQGTVILYGTNTTLDGNWITYFNNLIQNGTGPVTLQQDVLVGGTYATSSGVLNLGNQVLDLNSHNLIINNPSPTAIAMGNGFIESERGPAPGYGTIEWKVGGSMGSYVFPFGNSSSSDYLPVAIKVIAAGVGAGSLTVATYPTDVTATPNNRALPTGVGGLTNQLGFDNSPNVIDRYWITDFKNYTTPPALNMTMTYRDSEWDGTNGSTNTIVESSLLAQHWDGATWVLPQVGNINTANNTMDLLNVDGFQSGIWTFAGNYSPLPVELLSFTAHAVNNNSVSCNWSTASEKNNNYFEVERSRDATHFEKIGTVDGAGNSSHQLNYQFTDAHPYEGVSYYRLKQVDFDGAFTYSKTEPVRIDASHITNTFNVYPNPANSYVQFTADTHPETAINITLLDMNGKIILRKLIQPENFTSDNRVDLSTVVAGTYVLQLSNTTFFEQQRITVVH